MVTHRDVTDKIRIETALREKARALEDAEKLKTDFLANVSYQLRTPLNAMTGFAEILANKYFGDLNPNRMNIPAAFWRPARA
jgi:signal transduction histidine kinase